MYGKARTKAGKRAYKPRVKLVSARSMGSGDYSSTKAMVSKAVKSAVKSALVNGGGMGGNALGSKIGLGALGAKYGSRLGAKISKMIGSGDYVSNQENVVENALFSTTPSHESIHMGEGDILLTHSEYVSDIVSSGSINTFNNQSFAINAFNPILFPWLAQIACNYEEYKFIGLIFRYKSTSSDSITASATSTSLGTVIMAVDYNPSATPQLNKYAMDNLFGSVSAKPSCSILCGVECMSNQNVLSNLYTRFGAQTPANVQTTDMGLFQIATVNPLGASQNLGELYVDFKCILRKPRMYASLGNFNQVTHLFGTGFVSGAPLGTARTLLSSSSINGFTVTNSQIIFPPLLNQGLYRIDLTYFSTNPQALSIVTTNCNLPFYLSNTITADSAQLYNFFSATASSGQFSAIVNIQQNQAFVSFTTATLVAGNVDIWITQLPLSLITA